MSDTTEVIQSTIDKVLERVDLLAAKLGIAAKEIWRFSVTARVIEAKADFLKSALLILVAFVAWGWAVHIARTPIPHEYEYRRFYGTLPCHQQTQYTEMVNGKKVMVKGYACEGSFEGQDEDNRTDKGPSSFGWLLVISGIATALAGLWIAIKSVSGVVDALASIRTAEYDAYQDLIYDWKD